VPLPNSNITAVLIQAQCLPNLALDIRNHEVADLSGVDIIFTNFLLVACIYFVTKLMISSHNRGNNYRLVDLYINQCLDL
jgi:hypothetical protein